MKNLNTLLILMILILVSFQDLQAQCNGIEIPITSSLIPNTSFDDRDCCPDGVTPPDQQMDCINDHIQASDATIDYHVVDCGQSLDHPCLPYVPSGTPSGNGILGMVNESGWKEYLGTCLTGSLSPNTEYILKFKIGFGIPKGPCTIGNPPQTFDLESFSPVTFSIYGTSSCSSLPFIGSGCPPSNWILLGSISLSGYDEWSEESIPFTVPQTMNAIVFGPGCSSNPPSGKSGYYYLDDMLLNEINNPTSDLSISGHPCSGLTLEVENNSLLTYQWFYNNIPIFGAISNTYPVPVGQEGNYFVRMSYGNQCLDSEGFAYEVPSYETNLNKELCFGESIQIGNSTFDISGDYEVSLTTSNGCDSTVYLSLIIREELVLEHVVIEEILCAGGTAEVMVSSNAENPQNNWSNGSNGEIQNLLAGNHEVFVVDGFGCESDPYLLLITEPDSLELDFVTTDETCVGYEDGTSQPFVGGGVFPYYIKMKEDEGFVLFNDSMLYTELSPGNYEVVVMDENECLLENDFTILPRNPVDAYILSVDDPVAIGDSSILSAETDPVIDIEFYKWQGNRLSCDTCPEPITYPLLPPFNTYGVSLIEREVGCVYHAMLRVEIIDGVYIPNVFSPNDDGIDDVFYIQVNPESVVKVNVFNVFDRWGEHLFEANDFQPNDPGFGWDGFFRGVRMQPGVYIYFAEIALTNGQTIIKKGTITSIY